MAQTLPYTVYSLGEARLHQLYTSSGKVRERERPPLLVLETNLRYLCPPV
jgi:hypothetical protein